MASPWAIAIPDESRFGRTRGAGFTRIPTKISAKCADKFSDKRRYFHGVRDHELGRTSRLGERIRFPPGGYPAT